MQMLTSVTLNFCLAADIGLHRHRMQMHQCSCASKRVMWRISAKACGMSTSVAQTGTHPNAHYSE